MALYHGAFGFTSVYRRALVARDMGAVHAQIIMIALAMVLFAPLLVEGSALGKPAIGGRPSDVRVVASQSLHGWIWRGAASVGTWTGIYLRPLFGLAKDR